MSVAASGSAGSRRRESLLEAAAELFAARGYHAVSTDDIGHAVGISGPAVYRHFTSKAQLLLTVCEAAMEHLLAGAHRIGRTVGSDTGALAELVAFHVDFAVRERAVLAVYLREQRELPVREFAALRRRQREYESVWCGAVAAQRPDLPATDVRATVKVVLSMLNGTAYIRDNIPRPRLVELLHRLAAGALGGVGIDVRGRGD